MLLPTQEYFPLDLRPRIAASEYREVPNGEYIVVNDMGIADDAIEAILQELHVSPQYDTITIRTMRSYLEHMLELMSREGLINDGIPPQEKVYLFLRNGGMEVMEELPEQFKDVGICATPKVTRLRDEHNAVIGYDTREVIEVMTLLKQYFPTIRKIIMVDDALNTGLTALETMRVLVEECGFSERDTEFALATAIAFEQASNAETNLPMQCVAGTLYRNSDEVKLNFVSSLLKKLAKRRRVREHSECHPDENQDLPCFILHAQHRDAESSSA